MKAWSTGDCDHGGDEWSQEIRLTEQAVQAINKLNPKPKFFVLCGDLIHAMPGTPWRQEQTEDLQRVLRDLDREIPLVLVSGNHDLGNVPTAETIEEFSRTWGDDYFSFWVGGVLFLVLNSQFWYNASQCPALKQAQDHWLDQQLSIAGQRKCRHAIIFQHIPLFVHSIDEEDGYFNLTKAVRKELADKFTGAGSLPLPHAVAITTPSAMTPSPEPTFFQDDACTMLLGPQDCEISKLFILYKLLDLKYFIIVDGKQTTALLVLELQPQCVRNIGSSTQTINCLKKKVAKGGRFFKVILH
ncbi:serine/threonine-protein phosphatase CPPED1 isoform X2 [Heterocephalus glaber]|uniref:Serine/threonine-protein phosphatase CPPED1 isoform X2 n=1 Tax=Heterocephalus glaber TaxID=10181 RepID=A0AAX6R8L5_HETGA|nr:serine/threonine-protein phosphatase CPPED1 isoform X2 [Heterocephalus glaber]